MSVCACVYVYIPPILRKSLEVFNLLLAQSVCSKVLVLEFASTVLQLLFFVSPILTEASFSVLVLLFILSVYYSVNVLV